MCRRTKRSGLGIREGEEMKKRSCPRPLVARGDPSPKARGWGWGEKHQIRDAAHLPRPRLLHFPGAVLTPGSSSAGSGSCLGKWEALPTDLQCKEQQPFPPQLPPSVSAKSEFCSCFFLFLFWLNPDLTWPNLQLTVRLGTRHKGGTVLSRKLDAERRPELFWEPRPEAAQAETRLAGTSGSGPAELSTARGGGAPTAGRGGWVGPGYSPPEHTLQPAGLDDGGGRAEDLGHQALCPSPTSLRRGFGKTNRWENLERRFSWASASPHPRVPGARAGVGTSQAQSWLMHS